MSRKRSISRNTDKKSFDSLSRTLKKRLQIKKRDDDFVSTARNSTSRAFDYKKAYRSFLDRRYFRPDESVRTHRLINSKRSYLKADFKHGLGKISFERPKRELLCRQRKERRQSLFGLGLVGLGALAKVHRWTQDSYISCK